MNENPFLISAICFSTPVEENRRRLAGALFPELAGELDVTEVGGVMGDEM
jgi:hypothetical protein